MGYADLKVAELEAAAEEFQVEVKTEDDSKPKKADYVKALEDALPWEDYLQESDAAQELAVEPKKEEGQVLIKFERKNPTYEISGLRFTAAHPFQAVSESTADALTSRSGFRRATAAEVSDFYS